MKFAIDQSDLLQALTMLKPSVATRSSLDILRHVRITVEDNGGVFFEATNLESWARVDVCCWWDEPGVATVNFAELLAVVTPLKGERLKLQAHEGMLVVESESITSWLEIGDPTLFPESPRTQVRHLGKTWDEWIGNVEVTREVTHRREYSVELPVEQFKRAVDLVSYAAEKEDHRPILTALPITLENDVLRVAAADAFRVSQVELELPGAGTWDKTALPPARAVAECLKKFPKRGILFISMIEATTRTKCGKEVSSRTGGPFLFLACGTLEVAFRLIEGTFPAYKHLLNVSGTTLATVSASALLRAFKTVAPIIKESSDVARLAVNGHIQVKAQHDRLKEPTIVNVPAKTTGDDLEIYIRCQQLQGILSASPKSNVTIGLTEPEKPFKVTLDDEPGFVAVVMAHTLSH